jgi:hypothetical protein
MEFIGTIEPDAGAALHHNGWIALICAHPSLAPVQTRQGINPFTKEPYVYQPPTDYAHILLDGKEVGAIHWTMDDSRRLVVWSMPGVKTRVIVIAQDVASKLGCRFLHGTDAERSCSATPVSRRSRRR